MRCIVIDFLKTLDENFSKAVRLVGIVLMAFIFVMFILNVFVRFVPVYIFTQTDDWIQFCLIWMIFLGSLDLVRTKNHFVVDFLADRLSNRKIKIALKILVTIIELLTYFVIFYFGVIWVIKSNSYMQSIPWMQVRWMYVAIPFSCFFMCIYSIRDIYNLLRGRYYC